jgi:hypothetical protein
MTILPFPSRAADLSPEQRRRQVAAIFARGVLRFQRLVRRSASESEGEGLEKPLELGQTGLEVPGETRLSVSRRIGG